ncbi:type II/IV secretion system protein [Candidatus Falkowbacteria bacterium]|nr:type II/IV secretion system protein [Candidatus Falkowbacteria bacterium]
MTQASSSIEDLLSSSGKAKLKGQAPSDGQTPAQTSKTQKMKSTLRLAPLTRGKLYGEAAPQEKLKEKLEEINIADEEKAVMAKGRELNVPYIDLLGFPMNAEALQTIPENICREKQVACFLSVGDQVRLGAVNPVDSEIEKIKHNLEESLNVKGEIYIISERSFKKAMDLYARLPKFKAPVQGVEIKEDELEKFKQIATDFRQLNEQVQKVTMTELVTLIIAAAVQSDSSDIHIEAEEKEVKVRLRVDGILHDTASITKANWPKVISRIKLLAGLKLNITDKPQDGRFTITLTKEKIDVRVSCIPTTWGESVVMRLLKSSTASLKFEDLGLTGKSHEDLKFQVERPNGMIVTTGPTGSGKTTTLYAILNKLNKEGVKIITLEDPVEYKLEGINQSQIDHNKGYSFADGLRSSLRQDPDIVMVGEMRDFETADTAINAALTGHLVISTIHTNSAAGAVPRFLAMGVKQFLLAPALNAVMGQRLVRRLCQKCKYEIQLEPDKLERVKKILSEISEGHPDKPDLTRMVFYEGKGCEACHGLGYKGRVGIYEIMAITPEIKKLVLETAVSEYDMQQVAIKNNMITMVQDGLIKVLQGITSVDEVFRVSE